MEALNFAETLRLASDNFHQFRVQVKIEGAIYAPSTMFCEDGIVSWDVRPANRHRKLINVLSEAKALKVPAEARLYIGESGRTVSGVIVEDKTIIILTQAPA